jgi:hypothetical protein
LGRGKEIDLSHLRLPLLSDRLCGDVLAIKSLEKRDIEHDPH